MPKLPHLCFATYTLLQSDHLCLYTETLCLDLVLFSQHYYDVTVSIVTFHLLHCYCYISY